MRSRVKKFFTRVMTVVGNILWMALTLWIRGFGQLLLLWWKGMQVKWLNILVLQCTIASFSALPVWIWRLFGDIGLAGYFIGLFVAGFSCIAALLARSYREFIRTTREESKKGEET